MVIPALLALLAATVFGAPVFVVLGGAALILFWGDGSPIASLTVDHYRPVVTNPIAPHDSAVHAGGLFPRRRWCVQAADAGVPAVVGQFRGGPAIVIALVCAFFTSFTGASGVTILALGGLLMPVLLAAGYSERVALGLLHRAPGRSGCSFPPACR